MKRSGPLPAAACALAVAGCFGGGAATADPGEPRGPYLLCVTNSGIYDFRIYANDFRLGLIRAGSEREYEIPAGLRNTPIAFEARAVDTGRSVQVGPLQLGAHQSWHWTVSNSPTAGRAHFRMSGTGGCGG